MANLLLAVKFTIIAGLCILLIGQLIPREYVKFNRFPYKGAIWENNGKIYEEKFSVSKWKGKVLDMSKFYKKMYPKKITKRPDLQSVKRLIAETCVAESSHFFLILISPYLLFKIGGLLGLFYMLLYISGNVPFIIIQRYNRPRLIKLYDKFSKKETADNDLHRVEA